MTLSTGSFNEESVQIELPDGFMEEHPDAELLEDGKTLLVPDQGTWSVNSDGTITYEAEEGTTIVNPTPISYSVEDTNGNRLNTDAQIVLSQSVVDGATDTNGTGEVCVDYEESSVSLYGNWMLLLVALLGTMFGGLLMRKEKNNN